MIFRSLILPLTIAIIGTTAAREAQAQSAPAARAEQANNPAFPPVSAPPIANVGTAPLDPFIFKRVPTNSAECENEFATLREETEKRGRLIKDASARHAGPEEACKLIGSYAQAESKMISFVESHAIACEIPASLADRLRSGHKATEALQTQVCNVAQQMQRKGPAAGPVGDFDLGDDLHRQGY